MELLGATLIRHHVVLLGALGHLTTSDDLSIELEVAIIIHCSLTTFNHIAEDAGGMLTCISLLFGYFELLHELLELCQLLLNSLGSQ